ncbi:MAG: ParB/RepB/Spo0J family partition protein [Gammaproteobacteria bacterium]|nr:ParB/RepB/Spo0J family partition protein [Gammaproteobacteria bacterium]
MTIKKRGLGRGLDALLGGINREPSAHASVPAAVMAQGATEIVENAPEQGELRRIAVDLLQPGKYQPRHNMHNESLEDLASSIKAQGVVQPIVVRQIGGGRYEIIAGERRWRAAQMAQLHEIPAVVRDVPDEAAIAMALIENIQREDLNPLEEAGALQRLIDEFGMTHQQVAEAVGRSRTAVTNLLRLLALNPDVKQMVDQGELEMGHARALLALQGVPQSSAAKEVVQKGLSVRETEKLVQRLQAQPATAAPAPKIDPNIRNFETNLAEKLGAKVTIQHGDKGSGKLLIHYNTLDELEGILGHIQ